MRNDFVKELIARATQDESIVLLTGDLGFSVLDPFVEQLPRQFLNCGVAEQAMMSIAAGMASTGKQVFVYSIVNFATFRGLEQIRNDISYHNYNVCVVAVGAGSMYGSLGYSHHGLEDISVMRGLPSMSIYAPSCKDEIQLTIKDVLATGGPSYVRLGRSPDYDAYVFGAVPGMRRLTSGGEVVVLACGAAVQPCMDAAARAKQIGISVEVWAIYRVSPLSSLQIHSIIAGRPTLTVEDHSTIGGLGSAVVEATSEASLRPSVRRLGFPGNEPAAFGTYAHLMEAAGICPDTILSNICDVAK